MVDRRVGRSAHQHLSDVLLDPVEDDAQGGLRLTRARWTVDESERRLRSELDGCELRRVEGLDDTRTELRLR